MTQVLSLTSQDMQTVGASVHRHMSLDTPFRRRGSFELAPDGKSSLNFFREGPGRNRTSTVNNTDARYGMFEPLSTGPSGQLAHDGSRDIICLCTPAPKIPRPRNAFILYRQHHQSQVTAENPKLSNPEISKIIGDKWKHEGEEVKENWKKLAEEEKQRHQHQYPNYRYQPRRGTKTQGNWTSTSPTDEHGRCPKCHGRSISTPRTPLTPFSSSPAGNFTIASQMQPSLARVDTAVSSASRRSSFELSPTSSLPFAHQLHLVRDIEQGEPSSPEMKRRRANGTGGYHAITGAPGAYTIRPPPDLGRTPPQGNHNPMRYYAGTTLPDLVSLPRSQSGPMPPPLRPTGSSSWAADKESLDPRHSGFDESLRLPPLQTSIPSSPARSPSLDGRFMGIPSTRLNLSPIWDQQHPTNLDAKSASMEPSLTQKLKILSAVCDPLPCADNRLPHFDKRGAFISVEGANPNILDQVGRSLEKILVAGDDVALKVWTNDEPGESHIPEPRTSKSQDVEAGLSPGAVKPEVAATAKEDLLSSYFKTILSWRRKSKQIAHHVTDGRVGESLDKESQDKDGKTVSAWSTTALTSHRDDLRPMAAPKRPVALVKGGFSLTISDRFASAIPISDNYTLADHWQWMANLWRGTANPDLVVHVQESRDGQDETGVVDVSKRMGLITVKVPRGHSLDEATERRLAFEVMEWMREGRNQDEALPIRRQDSF
ncbi:hypothetical protein E4U42_007410 [Claviceps africana]|uniref:HMG box domain-containing protein n=1 Tax=Claviceps africana TaxID=83212 RepID=A0A8K0NEL0_9HYPO|nr:hypothetical protein E4U42_007410 [Claviceps africana]